jgi:hypothetical protein
MSISSMTSDFTVTIKRQTSTVSAGGAKKVSFSTAKRTTDGVPTSVSASLQGMSSEEKSEYGIKSSDSAWCMYTASNPYLQTEDQVEWTDDSDYLRICRISGPSYGMAGKGRIWLTVVRETKTEL